MSIETRNISIPMPADSRAVKRQERCEQRKERNQTMRKRAASVLGVIVFAAISAGIRLMFL